MTSRSFAPRGSQNVTGSGRTDVTRGNKLGQRVVLGVLTENDQHNRAFGPVSFKNTSSHGACVPRACDVGVAPVCAVEPLRDQAASVWLPTERLALSGALYEINAESAVDCSMQSVPEEEVVSADAVLCCSDYAEDIHQFLRECEVRYKPNHGYMRKQPDISDSMRLILVDWLVEVSEEYKLSSETFLLAVNYLDRFLSMMSVLRGKLQLVGTASLLLAAKYEEVYPPEVNEFVYITDDTYTRTQILRMEQHLLRVLAFDLTAPTTHQFLLHYSLVENICTRTLNLALYLSELSLLELAYFAKYLPSKMAAAAYCLANYTLNGALWPEKLYSFTGYSLAVIGPCLKGLHELHQGSSSRPQQAIQEKYQSAKYCGASLLKPVPSLPFL